MRVGIVGAGVIAQLHAGAISELPDAECTAVVDTNRERAEALAETYGAASFGDIGTFLSEAQIDIVAICTPSGLHRDAAVAAAQAGKHVLVEKPIEVTVERAEAIRQACRENGVHLGGVFQTRFHPAARRLQRAVKENAFGRVSLVSAEVKWYRTQEYYDTSGWRGTWALDGGGALMNQSIHVVDMLRWMFGYPTEIYAVAGLRTHEGLEVEDTIATTLRFPSGVIGTIQATTGAWPGSFKTIEVCGEFGHVRLEEDHFSRWEFAPESAYSSERNVRAVIDGHRNEDDPRNTDDSWDEADAGGGVVSPTEIGTAAHRRQYQDFLQVVRGNALPEVTDEDAIEAVRFVEDIYRAAGIGRRRTLKRKTAFQ